jgi:hypothetical protein
MNYCLSKELFFRLKTDEATVTEAAAAAAAAAAACCDEQNATQRHVTTHVKPATPAQDDDDRNVYVRLSVLILSYIWVISSSLCTL